MPCNDVSALNSKHHRRHQGSLKDGGVGFSGSNFGFPVLVSFQSSSTRCAYEQGSRATRGNLPESSAVAEIRENWIEKVFHSFFKAGLRYCPRIVPSVSGLVV